MFDYLAIWVRVKDLLLNKITHIFARHLGDWLEEIATVDVEKHGSTRNKMHVHEPLVRGFRLKSSPKGLEGTSMTFSMRRLHTYGLTTVG